MNHTQEGLDVFKDIQRQYFSADSNEHFRYVEKVTDYVDKCMRSFLYASSNLLFGPTNYFEKVAMQDKKYALQNAKNRVQYSTVSNLFDGLTRSQFRTVFVNKGDIKTCIVDSMGFTWPEDDRTKFFNLFAEESIATSHRQTSVYSLSDRDRYAHYGRYCEVVISTMNESIKKLMADQGVVVVEDQSTSNHSIADCIFYFGMQLHRKRSLAENHILEVGEAIPFANHEKLVGHSATQADLDKVMSTLNASFTDSTFLTEDLLDLEYLRNHYDVPFTALISCLLYVSRVTKAIRVIPWFGSSIMILKNN